MKIDPFYVIKNPCRHRKTRYRGMDKNSAQLFMLFAFFNLVLGGTRFTATETRTTKRRRSACGGAYVKAQ